jgi:hypothetical protein
MKTLTIGDIHGREAWKFFTHGSCYEYNHWRISVDAGATASDYEFWKEMPYTQYDKIIFVGDYVDAYDKTSNQILENLKDIIHFKNALGDKVVLLTGNHDVQYIVPKQICSGYRPEMITDLNELFRLNNRLFMFAYEYHNEKGDKWLWTHAGVSSGWYDDFQKLIKSEKYRFKEVWAQFLEEERTVADILNFAWDMKMISLFDVDSDSGGIMPWGSPIWVRPRMLNYWPMKGYNQIVGHTPQHSVSEVDQDLDGTKFENFKHYFVDVLGRWEFTEPLTLEI